MIDVTEEMKAEKKLFEENSLFDFDMEDVTEDMEKKKMGYGYISELGSYVPCKTNTQCRQLRADACCAHISASDPATGAKASIHACGLT